MPTAHWDAGFPLAIPIEYIGSSRQWFMPAFLPDARTTRCTPSSLIVAIHKLYPMTTVTPLPALTPLDRERGDRRRSPIRMKTLASMLIVALALASNACAESIRVATYNLNWGNRRGDQVLDAIKTAAPDVICLQETTLQSERFLRERLADTHPHFHAIGHNGRYAGERFAVASKIELSDLTFAPPTAGLFGFYSARVNFAGTRIHIVNVHLTPFQIKRGGGIRDAMTALSTTEDKHAIEIDAIIDAIDCQRPTIVAGDFNSISSFQAPIRLVGLGLIDAYASIHDDADAHPTWNWPTRPLPLVLRIDYIFHTPHFTTTESEIIRRDGSDHSLVVAVLKCGEPIRI
ncbi:endonuclease/exonuclease/phosphatase family protein [Stieleria sp. TO1_6]|uniref:endonuclease/exonuclease/phosphatase family protein n=1 Tax=Stieleria tagensis TaxID=2956795 RepID=UPI00209A9389|nr:endonuclease/exonuclease/phosphatase family protein [Stieleria tagensis]MCO8120107.1 endonuclease/exonuclease/phosphatase family protein [Stieleria tagensis]